MKGCTGVPSERRNRRSHPRVRQEVEGGEEGASEKEEERDERLHTA